MIYPYMVGNTHGQTSRILLPWRNWTECYVGLQDSKLVRPRLYFKSHGPKLDGFQEVVCSAWASVPAGLCPFLTLDKKFKAATKGL